MQFLGKDEAATFEALKKGLKQANGTVETMNLNEQNNNGDTLLHIAVKQGWRSVLKWLLENKVNVGIRNNANLTPFNEMLNKKYIVAEVMHLFIEDGTKYMVTKLDMEHLHVCGCHPILQNDLEVIKIILTKLYKSNYRDLIIDKIIENRNITLLHDILEYCKGFFYFYNSNRRLPTILHAVIFRMRMEHRLTEFVEKILMIESIAERCNYIGNGNLSILELALRIKNLEVVRLLSHKTNCMVKYEELALTMSEEYSDDFFETVISLCRKHISIMPIIQQIFEKKRHAKKRNILIRKKTFSLFQFLDFEKISHLYLKSILESGYPPTSGFNGKNLLHFCIRNKLDKHAILLIKFGATKVKFAFACVYKYTNLLLCMELNKKHPNQEIVRQLIYHGADLDKTLKLIDLNNRKKIAMNIDMQPNTSRAIGSNREIIRSFPRYIQNVLKESYSKDLFHFLVALGFSPKQYLKDRNFDRKIHHRNFKLLNKLRRKQNRNIFLLPMDIIHKIMLYFGYYHEY